MQEHSPRLARITALGLAAAAAAYLPPFHAAARADRALYDLWSRLSTPTAPAEIVIVPLDDPAGLDAVALLTRKAGATLVTTFPQPTPGARDAALGPVDLPVGGGVLRGTAWPRGGHLYFPADADGVVRNGMPLLEDDPPTPSLALAAIEATGRPDAATPAGDGTSVAVGGTRFGLDGAGRRPLRFFSPASFRRIAPAALGAAAESLAGKIVVTGPAAPAYRTPVGRLSARDLLAETIAGYRRDAAVHAGAAQTLAPWLLAAVLLGILLRAEASGTTPAAEWTLAAAPITIVVASAAAFALAGEWLPPVGPSAVLLGCWLGTVARGRAAEPDLAARDAAAPEPAGSEAAGLEAAGPEPAAPEPAAPEAAAPEAPASPAPPGTPRRPADLPAALGRYEVVADIGRGAMGRVLLGRDPKINREVAIKAVDLAAECEPEEFEEARARFLREAETAGRLNHPNIVTIYDVGESGSVAYIAMEYLSGRRLADFAAPESLLRPALVLDLLSRTADALDYAHHHNVVHRDIKPANIMYDSASNTLKLTDFGIARSIDSSRTRNGIVLGTPYFMAPEQLEGRNVNGHTDLFALGVSLYQLLTGHLPFRGASMTKLMFVIANEPHKPVRSLRPDLPGSLDTIIDRALAKEPSERFRTGAEMAAAMRRAAGQLV